MRIVAIIVLFVMFSVLGGCNGSESVTQDSIPKQVSYLPHVQGLLFDPCNEASPPHGIDVEDVTLHVSSYNAFDYWVGIGWNDTDEDGYYDIISVPGSGYTHEVGFLDPEWEENEPDIYNPFSGYLYHGPLNDRFELDDEQQNPGFDKTMGRILAYQPGSYSISGNIDDQDLLTEAQMLACSISIGFYNDPENEVIGVTSPDKDGNWSISGFAESCWRVVATNTDPELELYPVGSGSQPLHVDANVTGIDFVLF